MTAVGLTSNFVNDNDQQLQEKKNKRKPNKQLQGIKNTINIHSMKNLRKTCKFQKLKNCPSNQRGSMGRGKDTYEGQE